MYRANVFTFYNLNIYGFNILSVISQARKVLQTKWVWEMLS